MSASARTQRIFDSLLGEWQLDRVIHGFGAMAGTATFSRLDDYAWLYREDGVIELLSGGSNPAFREFIYRLDDDAIVVEFHNEPLSKGVLFQLKPNSAGDQEREPFYQESEACSRTSMVRPPGVSPWPATADAEHPCRDDVYRGRYLFESPERFRTEITIDGPGKAWRIETVFSKQ